MTSLLRGGTDLTFKPEATSTRPLQAGSTQFVKTNTHQDRLIISNRKSKLISFSEWICSTYEADIWGWHVVFVVDRSLAGAAWAWNLAGTVGLHHHHLGSGGGVLSQAWRWGSISWGGGGGCLRSWSRAGGLCSLFCMRLTGEQRLG